MVFFNEGCAMDSTCKGYLSTWADQCSTGDERKGTPPAGTDGGHGIHTASIPQYQELLIDTFIMDFYCI